jgi:PAS domain S-box-containing protein
MARPPHTTPAAPGQSALMAQASVLVTGLSITLVVCIALGLFLDGVLRADADAARGGALRGLIGGLERAQATLDAGAGVLGAAGAGDVVARGREGEVRAVAQAAATALPAPFAFDHVVWAHEHRPGMWRFVDLYARDLDAGAETRWAAPSSADFARFARRQGLPDLAQGQAFAVFPGLPNPAPPDAAPPGHDGPIALVRAVEPGDARAGVLIGRTRVGLLSQGAVKGMPPPGPGPDMAVGWRAGGGALSTVLHTPRGAVGPDAAVYHFTALGQNWEAQVSPAPGPGEAFLTYLPLYCALLGGAVTLLVLLYVRATQAHTARMGRVNRALEQKNFELEVEVAERERVARTLRRSQAENRAIIDSVNDVIFEADADGSLAFLSAAWARVTGMEVGACLGQRLSVFVPPADAQRVEDVQREALTAPEARRLTTALRTAGGTHRSVRMTLSTLQRKDGEPARLVGTITDVEERERAEAALRETESKFRAIVEHAAGGIYQLTPDGLYLSANPAFARILGYADPGEVLRAIADARTQVYADPEAHAAFVQELEANGAAQCAEMPMRRKDGTHIWVSESARVVRDREGQAQEILYYEGSIEDVTARRAAVQALRDAKLASDMASRSKSEFLANMSHELRTPLNAIIGFAEIIKAEAFGALGTPEYKEYATDIHDNGRRLLAIINEILDISRIEAGERQLAESAVDLSAVVRGAVEALAPKIRTAEIEVDTRAVPAPCAVVGEERALKQIVLAVLSNAVKFTPPGGSVTIAARPADGGALALSLTDTGIGMDARELKRALEPFGQVDTALDRSGSGTGLGLTLVQALTALHGGEFDIVSEKGIGTTVTITLPPERVGA